MVIAGTTEEDAFLPIDQPMPIAPLKRNLGYQLMDLVDVTTLQHRDIWQLVKQHFKDVFSESQGDFIFLKGKPYLEEFDVV